MITRDRIISSATPHRPLGELVEFLDHMRRPVTATDRATGTYPYFGANGQQGTIDGYIFDEPLVLLAEDGGHFSDPDRGVAYSISGKTWVNNHAHVLRPRAAVDLRYLTRALEHYDLVPFVTGTTRAKLTKAQASKIPVPVPPLGEQRRIAAILDKADALRVRRQRSIKLVGNLTDSIFHAMFGNPRTTVRFETESLPEICTLYSGGTPSKSNPSYWRGDLPWFSPKDLKADDLWDSIDHISARVPNETSLRLLRPGTVAIVVRGMILAHSIPISVLRCEATINQDLKALLPKVNIDAQFLAACIRAQRPDILDSVSTAAHGTKRLDARALQAIRIVRPGPGLEQEFMRRTVACAEQHEAANASARVLDHAFASLQSRAFAGEL